MMLSPHEKSAWLSLYRPALERIDATALTQALGTKDAESLRPWIKRFILEEDGLLLLCSDGLSDHNWVEQSWQDYAIPVLTGQLAIEDAVRDWINLANEKNGHDNTSVVLTLCRVSKEYLVPVTQSSPPVEIIKVEEPQELEELETESSFAESSQALLDLDLTLDLDVTEAPTPTPVKQPIRRQPVVLIGGLLGVLLAGTSLGLFAWWQVNPQGFQQICRQLPQRIQPLCPPQR